MKNPLEGWNILTDILETEGIMKIGLYSKLARKELLKFKRKIDIRYKLRNVKGIKKLRHNIIHNNLIKLPNIFKIKNDNIKDEIFKLNEKFDYYDLSDWHYFEEKNI